MCARAASSDVVGTTVWVARGHLEGHLSHNLPATAAAAHSHGALGPALRGVVVACTVDAAEAARADAAGSRPLPRRHLVQLDAGPRAQVCLDDPLATALEGRRGGWRCALQALADRGEHETWQCAHRTLACPLGCGQRLPLRALAPHVTRVCDERRERCAACGAWRVIRARADHDASCPQRVVLCECGAKVPAARLQAHADAECPAQPVPCPNGCRVRVLRGEAQLHTARRCRLRSVACPECGGPTPASDLEHHRSNRCPRRPATCAHDGCGARVADRDIPAHEAACPWGPELCPRPGCGATYARRDRRFHAEVACSARPRPCPLGCGATLEAGEVARHEAGCVLRLTECDQGCGRRVPLKEIAAHKRQHCPRRLVSCPRGCGERMSRADLPRHEETCLLNRVIECGQGGCGRRFADWLCGDVARLYRALARSRKERRRRDHWRVRIRHRAWKAFAGGSVEAANAVWRNACARAEGEEEPDLDARGSRLRSVGSGSSDGAEPSDGAVGSEVTGGTMATASFDASRDALTQVPCSRHHQTALTWAAARGKHEVVRVLVAFLAEGELEEEGGGGTTPLVAAAAAGNVRTVRLLLAAGADPNRESGRGVTPLAAAAREGHTDAATALWEAGAQPGLRSRHRTTAVAAAETVARAGRHTRGASSDAAHSADSVAVAHPFLWRRGAATALTEAFPAAHVALLERLARWEEVDAAVLHLMRGVSCGDRDGVQRALQHGRPYHVGLPTNLEHALTESMQRVRDELARISSREGALRVAPRGGRPATSAPIAALRRHASHGARRPGRAGNRRLGCPSGEDDGGGAVRIRRRTAGAGHRAVRLACHASTSPGFRARSPPLQTRR